VELSTDVCHLRLSTEEFDLRVWVTSEWIGEPTNRSPDEHDEISWFTEPLAVGLDLAHPGYRRLISEAFRRTTR
jgi:hypothetical protein